MNGELRVVDDVGSALSQMIVDAYQSRNDPTFSLALSGGGSARGYYETVADQSSQKVNWMDVDIYWGDERCVPSDSPDSNERLGREALLQRVGGVNSVHPMRCEDGPDAYHLKLSRLPSIDVVHLGVGPDGHTASLFPDSPALDADPGRFVALNHDPHGRNRLPRMTLTYSGIAKGRLIVFTVSGDEKREIMRRLVAGEDLPAARVTGDNIVWLVDHEAAPS